MDYPYPGLFLDLQLARERLAQVWKADHRGVVTRNAFSDNLKVSESRKLTW